MVLVTLVTVVTLVTLVLVSSVEVTLVTLVLVTLVTRPMVILGLLVVIHQEGWGVTRTAVQLYGYRRTFGSDRGRSEPSDS